MVSGAQEFPLWVVDGSHKYMQFMETTRQAMSRESKMQKLMMPPNSVFVGHGHLTHAGAAYTDGSGINARMHGYVIPRGFDLGDGVFFNFVESNQSGTMFYNEDTVLWMPPVHAV